MIILQVFRHPNHIQTSVFLWSHHEKIVVIDQTLAFIGGIDLCFGRYDDSCHSLADHGRPPPHVKSVSELAKAVNLVNSTYYYDHTKELWPTNIIVLKLKLVTVDFAESI